MKPILVIVVVAVLSALLLPMVQSRQAQTPGAPPRPASGPPQEAIAACAGLAVDDACTFTTPRGHALSGICFRPPEAGAESPIACRPDHPPRPARAPAERGARTGVE